MVRNASLGELYRLSSKLDFNIANGFALTINLYDNFIKNNNLLDFIKTSLKEINVNNIDELNEKSNKIKERINKGLFTKEQNDEIINEYNKLKKLYNNKLEVAVRSSALLKIYPEHHLQSTRYLS